MRKIIRSARMKDFLIIDDDSKPKRWKIRLLKLHFNALESFLHLTASLVVVGYCEKLFNGAFQTAIFTKIMSLKVEYLCLTLLINR